MSELVQEQLLPTYEQISAGGVVYRRAGSGIEVVIVQIVPEMRWQLPKGVIDEGESREQAALREVREESGLEAEIVRLIETTEYWFTTDLGGERRRCHKFVHFYLMKYRSGDVKDHDDEVAEARWVTIPEAQKMLTFKSERDAVARAVAFVDAMKESA